MLPIERPPGSKNKIEAIGEVVSASITGLVAEACQTGGTDGLPYAVRPAFGSFVRSESEDKIVAVVFDVVTGARDTSHKPAAFGLSREQLKLEQPHIFALLRTEIHAVAIGYFRHDLFFQHLPPYPAQVHDFLYLCTDEEIRSATNNLDFLRLLSGQVPAACDELIAAALRNAYAASGNDYQFLVRAGQALSHLFRDDYDRLLSLLKKIKPD